MGRHAEYTAEKGRRHARAAGRVCGAVARKAVAAQQGGKFAAEIVPVEIPGRKGPTIVDADEGPRADTTAESLAKLRPAFPGVGQERVALA